MRGPTILPIFLLVSPQTCGGGDVGPTAQGPGRHPFEPPRTGRLLVPRHGAGVVAMPDGTLLVIGGITTTWPAPRGPLVRLASGDVVVVEPDRVRPVDPLLHACIGAD